MPSIVLGKIVADLRSAKRFTEFLERGGTPSPGNPIAKGFENAAELYAEWLRRRFLRLSRAGGTDEWPDIEDETKDRKGSDDILIETGNLVKGIGKFRYKNRGWVVGYVGQRAHVPHPNYDGTRADLAYLLQETGIKNGKHWYIIVRPNIRTRELMYRHIRGGVSAAAKAGNRSNRRGN